MGFLFWRNVYVCNAFFRLVQVFLVGVFYASPVWSEMAVELEGIEVMNQIN